MLGKSWRLSQNNYGLISIMIIITTHQSPGGVVTGAPGHLSQPRRPPRQDGAEISIIILSIIIITIISISPRAGL